MIVAEGGSQSTCSEESKDSYHFLTPGDPKLLQTAVEPVRFLTEQFAEATEAARVV